MSSYEIFVVYQLKSLLDNSKSFEFESDIEILSNCITFMKNKGILIFYKILRKLKINNKIENTIKGIEDLICHCEIMSKSEMLDSDEEVGVWATDVEVLKYCIDKFK